MFVKGNRNGFRRRESGGRKSLEMTQEGESDYFGDS